MDNLRINVADAIQVEKYETALEDLRNASQPTGKASEVLKAQCNVIRKFFDTCFGDNTSKSIFGDSYDYMVHYDKLNELITKANNDLQALTDKMAKNASKYTANRVVRK